jgi:hypothetical protein
VVGLTAQLGGETTTRNTAGDGASSTDEPSPAAAETSSDSTPAPTPTGDGQLAPGDRRALRRAWSIGAIPTIAAFAWLIMAGRWAPLQRQYFDDFYDYQARAFLDGRWDIPRGAAGFEGFIVDGRTYVYFGPFPALLRSPLFLVTDRFDGRLTTISMTLAMVVAAVAGYHLNLAVRALVRGDAPVQRGERLATTGLAVAVLAGIPLWLASQATVFHEAIVWGLALAVAALAAALRWLARPTRWRLVATAALASAAMASRQPLGIAVLAGLGLLAAIVAAGRLAARRRGEPPTLLPDVPLGGLALACVAIALAGAVPNMAKFGNPISPSIHDHIATEVLPDRDEFLEANDGAYFGTQYVPTTLWQYVRPDALDTRQDFPWLDFPHAGPKVFGDTVFDRVEWTSSVPATMPVLVVLAVPGVVWFVRAARRRERGIGALALWVGTWAGASGAITIAYIGHRYVGDLAAIVILPAAFGVHALLGRDRAASHRLRRGVGVALTVLLAFSAWTNVALAIQYQRERGFNIPEEWRAELARWRADLPGDRNWVREVPADDRRLPSAPDGMLAVVGDCLGFYTRVGDVWYGVDRGPGVGVYELRVDLDALDDLRLGRRAPLASFVDGDDVRVITLTRLVSGGVRADQWLAGDGEWRIGRPADVDGAVTLRIEADPHVRARTTRVGRTFLNLSPPWSPTTEVTIGRAPPGVTVPGTVDSYPGAIETVPFDPSLCHDATGVASTS